MRRKRVQREAEMAMPSNHIGDDPWMVSSKGALTAAVDLEEQAAKFEIIEGIVPFDAQLGEFPKKCVPDLLHDALFGQAISRSSHREAADVGSSPTEGLFTYAILDAAKVVNLPELLEKSGLPHRCLFKGEAYDALKGSAPWIVRLDEAGAFIRNLFTRSDAPWHLWEDEPGIYLRSCGSIDDMWRHCRKFIRVQDEAGKWYYFRFWEPRWARIMLRHMEAIEAERFLSGIARVVALGSDGRALIVSRSCI